MKKIFSLLAGAAIATSLVGCPGETPAEVKPSASNEPVASAEPSPEVTPEAPVATPDPAESTAPVATPAPVESPTEVLETPEPQDNTKFTISGASAEKQSNFSYNITINGTGIGTDADYTFFHVEISGSTVPLVENGAQRTFGDASDIKITNNSVTFNWKPSLGAPTDNDLVKIRTQKKDAADEFSTTVRMAVSG